MKGAPRLGIPETAVRVACGMICMDADLRVPDDAQGIVLFAHGSGSSRTSPRNRAVARSLHEAGLGTLLLDLLTAREERADARTGHLRFDIGFLAERLVHAMHWSVTDERTRGLPIGLFGASTGAAAALVAAAARSEQVAAVVSRGGRPELAGPSLARVRAPTLLIVGGKDVEVLRMNEQALAHLGGPCKELQVVPGATHLFEEEGALESVARLAADWFARYVGSPERHAHS